MVESLIYLVQIFVTVYELSLMWVLEFVGLDILPQGLDDDGSGLCVNTQHPGQSRVQLKLRGLQDAEEAWQTERNHKDLPLRRTVPYLVIEHEQDGAANAHITRPLHLETISLLRGGSPMPLKERKKEFNVNFD